MPEEELLKTETQRTRAEIAELLVAAAEEIESGTVELDDSEQTQRVTVPEDPLFEVELERLTDSETGEMRYELEYEIRWTEAGDEAESETGSETGAEAEADQ